MIKQSTLLSCFDRRVRWKVTCPVAVLIALVVVAHLRSLDGLHGALFSAIWGEDTVYSEGYSDSKFRRIRRGMTEAEVETLLGIPLEKTTGSTPDTVVWRYSMSQNGKDYSIRSVLFFGGRVQKITHGFYLD